MTELNVTAEPGVPQILTSREFDAPARSPLPRVHRAGSARAVARTARVHDEDRRFDLRDGGTWRYLHVDDAGNEYGFHGVFHGDPSPTVMVQTFEFEGAPGHVSMDTVTFEEHDGGTTVRTNSVFQSVEARDAMVQSGMADGMGQGYERLEELLARRLKASHDAQS